VSATAENDALRAGAFVLVGAAVFTFAIFLLGQKSALMSRTSSLYVHFDDISGLVVGAPVRLAGLEVGTVAALELSPQLAERRTRVRLVVQTRYLARVRANSQAFIDTNGLLGDKIVNISMGAPEAAALGDGATLRAGERVSLESISATATRTLESAESAVGAVAELVEDGRTKALRDDAARAVGSLARLLDQVEHGDGVAHRLLYDRGYAEHVAEILSRTSALSARAQTAVARVDAVLAEVEQGEGSLHALIFGDDGKRALANLAGAAGELEQVVAAVRQGDGALHALIYDPKQGELLRHLDEIAATVQRIVQDVERGHGTLGGLLRDPTVYEQLKTLLGNVQRNVLFKALVRYTMERDDLRRMEDRPRVGADGPAQGEAAPPPP
jgi:phospholipid/cholesterol/gamma-HCH transport system substrate-binding protein